MRRRYRSPGPGSVHVLVLSFALLVVGCTGGGSTQATSPQPEGSPQDVVEAPPQEEEIDPATEEWIAAASKACQRYNETRPGGGGTKVYEEQIARYETLLDDLKATDPPADVKQDLKDLAALVKTASKSNEDALQRTEELTGGVFSSTAAVNTAAAAQRTAVKESVRADKAAQKALFQFARAADVNCFS